MSAMASQITSILIVYSTVCSGTDQRKHLSSASPVFVRRIHRWPVNSPHKGPVTRQMFPFDDVIMKWLMRSRGTSCVNTLRLRQNGCHFPDIFICVFLNEHFFATIFSDNPINNIPPFVQIMAWHRTGSCISDAPSDIIGDFPIGSFWIYISNTQCGNQHPAWTVPWPWNRRR